MKSIVFYCYKEDESTKKNLQYFINHGIFYSIHVTFIIIVNDYTLTLSVPSYCTIIYRNNSFDMPAYYDAIHKVDKAYCLMTASIL